MTSSPLPPDPYTALNVAKDASIDQIRSSYRKLVLNAHPDRFPQATAEEKQKKTDEFHKIQQAYELLTDDTRKQRYDERVKLAELKAELMKEKAASGRSTGRSAPSSQDYGSTRSFAMPTFETRPRTFYEEPIPVPKATPKKAYEEDPVTARYESSSKYDDYRASPRSSKHEDILKNGARKATTREHDAYRRGEQRDERDNYEEKLATKGREKRQKEMERQRQSDKKKSRDKDRRQASESKQYSRSPRVNDYADSESSDGEDLRSAPTSRRKAEDASRRAQRDPRSSRRSREADDYSDYSSERSHNEYYQRLNTREQDAYEYIRQARNPSNGHEDRARGSVQTSSRKVAAGPPPPIPPPAPSMPKEKTDSAKRSSASRKTSTWTSPPRETRSSRKEKPLPEIVEIEKSSRRTPYDSARIRPSLKSTESAPPKTESEVRHINKAQTWQSQPRPSQDRERERGEREREKDPRVPVRRSQTTPLEDMVNEHSTQRASHGASKLSRAENVRTIDTDDSEAETPPIVQRTQRFRYCEEPEDMEGPRIVTVNPEGRRSSRRESPPPRPRERTSSRNVSPVRRPTMPARGSASQHVPQRSSTLNEGTSAPRSSPRQPPGFARSSSNKNELFGEILRDDRDRPNPKRSSSNTSSFFTLKDVNFSPPIDQNSIRFASDRRRSPAERERERERGGRASDRDEGRERGGRESYPKDNYASRHASSGVSRAGKVY